MDIKKKIGVDGYTKALDTRPPEGSKIVSSFGLEAQVDVKPQELRKLRPFSSATKQIPSTLKPEAQIVLNAIFSCFDRQKSVQEGLIDDLVWGFEQAGIPGPCTVIGLKFLAADDYIKFQAPDNQFVEMTKENIAKLSVRYTPKLLNMVYEDPTSV